MIEIDGSQGEGGGQLVRTALALSTLIQKPFEVTDIRKNRPEPGLKAQHLTAIQALKQICNAQTSPCEIGSTSLRYLPQQVKTGIYNIDIGTAGSITLLSQALLPPLVKAQKKSVLTIIGGTCGKWQTPIEYFELVLLPFLQRFATITCFIQKRGYYPKGGGNVTITIIPKPHNPQQWNLEEQGTLVSIKGTSHASADLSQKKVAERQAAAAQLLLKKYKVPIDIQIIYSNTLSTGSGITLAARFHKKDEFHTILGADELGERMISAEDVGTKAAQKLSAEIDSGAAVDMHAADQLLPFLALSYGIIKTSQITEHTRSNIAVIEKFVPVAFSIVQKKIVCKASDNDDTKK